MPFVPSLGRETIRAAGLAVKCAAVGFDARDQAITRCWGLWCALLQGRFGALFHPLESDDAIVLRDCDVDEFLQRVQSIYGIELDGFRLG